MKKRMAANPSLLLPVLLSGCAYTQQQNVVLVTQRLDDLFTTLYPADEPGAAVMVVRDDYTVYSKGFGLARMDTKERVSSTTFFNIASVSKQLTAVALLILADEGKLSLDDSVSKFFPHFKADFYSRITLRHLLSHTSGIPDRRNRTDRDFMLYSNEQESCSFMVDLDSFLFEPGTRYDYQNPTYQLMQLIIERATGHVFDDFMRERILSPAGMTEATYFEPDKLIPRMAHGYRQLGEDSAWHKFDYGEEAFFRTKADGGLYTSAEEFWRWDKALYANIVMSKQLRCEAHKPRIETDIPYTSYGYGWFIEQRPDRPKKIYHTGDNGGFQIFAGRYPEKALFYLIFANRNDKNREDTVEKMDRIFEDAGWLK